MNIPPPKQRQPFSIEILKNTDKLSDGDDDDDGDSHPKHLMSDVNDNWINQIRLQFNQNAQGTSAIKSEEDQSSIQGKIEEYKETIRNLTLQNRELCDLDFENMSLSEIDSEIEKTKKNITYEESDLDDFQKKKEEFQSKIDRGYERLSDYKQRIVAFYNEICSWSDPLIKSKFGENENSLEIDVHDSQNISDEIGQHIAHLQNLKTGKKKK